MLTYLRGKMLGTRTHQHPGSTANAVCPPNPAAKHTEVTLPYNHKKIALRISPKPTSTVPSTSPRVIVDPILGESPRRMVTGRDSPVKADWSTSIRPSFTWTSQNHDESASQKQHQEMNLLSILRSTALPSGNWLPLKEQKEFTISCPNLQSRSKIANFTKLLIPDQRARLLVCVLTTQ